MLGKDILANETKDITNINTHVCCIRLRHHQSLAFYYYYYY
jgi:hypothetical protein